MLVGQLAGKEIAGEEKHIVKGRVRLVLIDGGLSIGPSTQKVGDGPPDVNGRATHESTVGSRLG